jgi:hypothetical protein
MIRKSRRVSEDRVFFGMAGKEIIMNGKKTIGTLCLLVAILFLSRGPVSAAPITGDPTFLLPNSATNTPVTFPSARTVANGYSLRSFYLDVPDSEGNQAQVWQETGSVFTNSPRSLSWGKDANNYSELYAAPGSFDTKAYHKAQTDGSVNNYTYGSSQVWNWYVLAGTPGAAVTLAADILIQGQAFANNGVGGNAGTIFGTSLGFLSSPEDLTQDYAIGLTGAVNWNAGFSTNNTVDENVLWVSGSATHDINLIIRSQPFTVTVGVPFRLSLLTATQGFAGPGAWGEAWSDFYDPRLVTSDDFTNISQLTPDGFAVVLGGGQYSTLGDAGYSIAPIPEPATMLLLGSGLIGLAGYGRKKFFKK